MARALLFLRVMHEHENQNQNQNEKTSHATRPAERLSEHGDASRLSPGWRRAIPRGAVFAAIGLFAATSLVLIVASFRSDGDVDGRERPGDPDPGASLAERLEALAEGQESTSPRLVSFYRARDYAPCWTTPDGLTAAGLEVMRALAVESADYGLGSPSDTHARTEPSVRLAFVDFRSDHAPAAREDAVALLEWRLSRGLSRLVEDLAHGRLDATHQPADWFHRDESLDVTALLEEAVERGPAVVLKELRFSHEERTGLQAALELYESIDRAGGWRELGPTEEPLERGVRSPVVEALRARLLTTGDLVTRPEAETDEGADLFDEALERGVIRFQERHGLAADGRVGESTFAALNVPSAVRLRQLQVNLERRRWLPRSFGPEYVWVNVPEYRLYAFRDASLALRLNVVVGAPETQTPLFADRLEYVVFNPYWNVPESIAVGELLPRHRAEPGYLRSRGFEAVDRNERTAPLELLSREAIESGEVRIRRVPGPANDLGRVKFMLPNDHNVYLHDTPARGLFARPKRAFSHGCIRLEHPMEFASYALEERLRSPEVVAARRAVEGDAPPVLLDVGIPVYIVYFTAFVVDGVVNFRDDVYGLDAPVWHALERSREPETAVRAARLEEH